MHFTTGIKRVVACHGSFATATCVTCRRQVDGALLADDIMDKRIARCSQCTTIEASSTPSFGVMKPDIVFFGESLPELFYSSLEADLPKVNEPQ
jgi:NAD-dependent SIR2 family protein deacetylase